MTDILYKNELDKACFAHGAAYSDSKNLNKRTAADKILRDKTYKIAKDPKYYGAQRGLASMVYKFFDKKSVVSLRLQINLLLNLYLKMNNLLMNFINPFLENLK